MKVISIRCARFFLQSKCWWFGAGPSPGSPPTGGVGSTGRHRHPTRPVQTEDTHVQRQQRGEPGDSHVPQHAGLHPSQQRAPGSGNRQPAGDPHAATQHTSDPDTDGSSHRAAAPAEKEPVAHGKSGPAAQISERRQKAEFLFVLLRETRCTPPRRCSRQPTRSPDQKRLSFWVSWLDPEVMLLQLKKKKKKLQYFHSPLMRPLPVCVCCREPMPRAGRHHPDQAKRAHGGAA